MKIFFLLNPSRQKKQWDFREAAAKTAHRHGWTARFGQVERERPQTSVNLLRQAAEEDCRRVVVIGGDGSLHQTVNNLSRQKLLKSTELAVVPAGTCNDFARALGLSPKRMDEALQVACTGKARPTDLGMMEIGRASCRERV